MRRTNHKALQNSIHVNIVSMNDQLYKSQISVIKKYHHRIYVVCLKKGFDKDMLGSTGETQTYTDRGTIMAEECGFSTMESRKKAKSRKWMSTCFKIFISAGLLIYLLVYQITEPSAIWNSILSANIFLVLAAFSLHFFGYLLSSWRWQILLKAQGVKV